MYFFLLLSSFSSLFHLFVWLRISGPMSLCRLTVKKRKRNEKKEMQPPFPGLCALVPSVCMPLFDHDSASKYPGPGTCSSLCSEYSNRRFKESLNTSTSKLEATTQRLHLVFKWLSFWQYSSVTGLFVFVVIFWSHVIFFFFLNIRLIFDLKAKKHMSRITNVWLTPLFF